MHSSNENSPPKSAWTADRRDILLQSVTPVEIVPHFGQALPALTGSRHRYLVAADGIWLEVARPWLHLVTKVGTLDSGSLPAGRIAAALDVTNPVPAKLFREFVRHATANAEKEVAAFITMDTSGNFRLRHAIVKDSSAAHINYQVPALEPGEDIVVDMHSHAAFPASFSSTDNADDHQMVKFALVVGNCDCPTPTVELRLCALGKFINLQLPSETFQ